jgi:DMSO/TMAO reductase YedYZ molybdopterin-dependent catalytic subunit
MTVPTDPTPQAPDDLGRGAPVGRRIVLGMLGLGAVGLAAGQWLSGRVSDVVGETVPALADVLPAAGGFRIYTVTDGYPTSDPSTYRLTVSGLVDTPLSLSLDDLAAMPQKQMTKDFQCVTGWRVDDVPWSGVALADVLDAAGLEDGAQALRFTSFDGTYTESLTLDQAKRPDVLVATTMYGTPLEVKHGAPVRLYVAPMYGYKSIKWLGGIEAVRSVTPGYWENLGYDVDAWIGASNGRSDDPNV